MRKSGVNGVGLLLAAFFFPGMVPVFAQQSQRQDMAVEQPREPSLDSSERRERRMRWIAANGRHEPPAPLNPGLSHEERRQLRNDVNQAGRELYPEGRRRLREGNPGPRGFEEREGTGEPPLRQGRRSRE